ncbi:MAG: hypothetical protein IJV95_02855 [Clostridia bacterium]|nr:hypothetical protein [Clostridia bacterium]
MENILNEQTELSAHTAEAEMEKGEGQSEVSLGKFKDVGALLNAYNSLQSEFTKRCQKIKELQAKIDTADKANAPQEKEVAQPQEQVDTTFKSEEEILKEYLLDVIGKKPKAIVLDGVGVGVKTPAFKPRTIEEAGNLARTILKN